MNRDKQTQSKPSKVEGEGSYSGTKQYNEKTAEFLKSGKVDKAAKEARQAIDGDEKEELEAAEKEGKSRSKGEDRSTPPSKKDQRH